MGNEHSPSIDGLSFMANFIRKTEINVNADSAIEPKIMIGILVAFINWKMKENQEKKLLLSQHHLKQNNLMRF